MNIKTYKGTLQPTVSLRDLEDICEERDLGSGIRVRILKLLARVIDTTEDQVESEHVMTPEDGYITERDSILEIVASSKLGVEDILVDSGKMEGYSLLEALLLCESPKRSGEDENGYH